MWQATVCTNFWPAKLPHYPGTPGKNASNSYTSLNIHPPLALIHLVNQSAQRERTQLISALHNCLESMRITGILVLLQLLLIQYMQGGAHQREGASNYSCCLRGSTRVFLLWKLLAKNLITSWELLMFVSSPRIIGFWPHISKQHFLYRAAKGWSI